MEGSSREKKKVHFFTRENENMRAWVFDDPSVPVSNEELEKVGVLYWKLNADTYQEDGTLEEIRKARNYKNS